MGKVGPVGDGSTAVPRAPAETGPLSSNRLPHLRGVFAEMKWPRRQSHSGGFAGLMSVIQQAQGGLQCEESPCCGGRMCTVLALGLAGTYSILLLWLAGLFCFFSPLS